MWTAVPSPETVRGSFGMRPQFIHGRENGNMIEEPLQTFLEIEWDVFAGHEALFNRFGDPGLFGVFLSVCPAFCGSGNQGAVYSWRISLF